MYAALLYRHVEPGKGRLDSYAEASHLIWLWPTPEGYAYDEKIWSMISAPVAITGRSSRR